MKLWGRFFWVVLAAWCRKGNHSVTGESVLRFRVWPWDCVVRYMSNDRYHAFADLGRIDLVIRVGWWEEVRKNKWELFVRSASIRYRAPLGMFQRFVLRTRIVYWDEHCFWMEHVFERKGRVVASAISRNAARNGKGLMRTAGPVASVQNGSTSPPCPEIVQRVKGVDELLKRRSLS